MRIDALFSPADMDAGLHTGRTFVVVDILRATSVIATALANGALDFRTAMTIDETRTFAEKVILLTKEAKEVAEGLLSS